MRHLFSSRVKAVLILALLITVLLSVVSSLTGLRLPEMFVQSVLAPIRSGASKLTESARQTYNYMFEYESLAAENEHLKQQLANLEQENRDADAISRENQRLRDLLELKTANEDYKLVDGYIISRSSQQWSSTFTINRGSGSGIKPGMCAVTANGELVGLVSEVGPNYSVVKSVMDSSMEVSATIASSGYSGMVKGGYSTGLDGLLRMNYLPSAATIRNNDQVVTAGSTVYPRGLVIGHVVDAGFDDTGVAKYALLQPAADIRAQEQVFIITEYNNG